MTGAPAFLLGRLAQRMSDRAMACAPNGLLLLAACCRWPHSPQRLQAIRAGHGEATDWAGWLALVKAHRVWGLAADGLAHANVAPPPPISRKLGNKCRSLVRRNLEMTAETLRLVALLNEAGIAVVVLKGISLSVLAYGNLSVKHSMDIDLLVRPDAMAVAAQALAHNGFKAEHAPLGLTQRQLDLLLGCARELGFRGGDSQPLIELHWKLSYNSCLLQGIGPHWPLQPVVAGGSTVHALAEEALFAYLCVHGAQHRWRRLKWLADLAALISDRDESGIDQLYRAAQSAGAGRCAGQALLLCQRLLGMHMPESLSSELRASASVLLLEALALQAMTGCSSEEDRPSTVLENLGLFLYLGLLGSGWRFYASEISRYLVSPADVLAVPLPPSLIWLYPVLRLPVWLWRWRPWRQGRA